jgi:catechol-2,3-dioxygenase
LFNIYNKSFRDTRQIYLYSTMASQVISPKTLAHVVLRTSPDKLKEMREFYLQLLGAKVSYENDWACFMTYDFEHHRIAVIAMPGIETKRIAASPGLEVNDGS